MAESSQGVWANTLEAVQRSASFGCGLCSLIVDIAISHAAELSKDNDTDGIMLDDYVYYICFSLSGNGTSLEGPGYNKLVVTAARRINSETVTEETMRSNRADYSHEICVAADPDSPAYLSGFIRGRYLGTDKTAPEYIAAIGEWVQGCISSHKECCQTISDDAIFDPYTVELPTRCIEVTSTTAHLRETAGVEGSYVILSHRWNPGTEVCKTMPSNYRERISGADLGSLSKTFDASIALVRRLGTRYLWIDSICIIQEKQDWDLEKWKMGKYYERALFTISAIGSRDQHLQHTSFLQTRPPKSLVCLPFRQDGARKGSVYLYKRDKNANLLFWDDIDGSELFSRGWVFQEWLLSKRIIYFTGNESFLECCSEKPQSFCNDMVMAPSDMKGHAHPVSRRQLNHGFKVEFASEHDSVFEKWYAAMRVFSTTNLTRQSDHLAAVSGAASEYGQAILKQTGKREGKGKGKGKEAQRIPNYLSGLWLQDIHHGLMWLAHTVKSPTCKCGAPSWSWLSCQGLIDWPPRDLNAQPALEILGANCEPVPEGAHGLPETVIMTLRLRVKAKMQPVLVTPGLGSRGSFGQATGMKFVYSAPTRCQKTVGASSLNRPYTVCHPETPNVAGGWAMFERSPKVGEWTRVESGTVSLAIQLASRRGSGDPGLARDFLNFGRTVFDVMFVESVGENTFQRLGAGMIFDHKILNGFKEDGGIEMTLA